MGNIFVNIPDKEDEEFRKTIIKKFGITEGMKKGALQKAAREAIKEWTEKNKSTKDFG